MKVFSQLDARDGASVEEFQTPDSIAEEKLVWKYWSEGTLRDINFQTDRIGLILIFEAGSVAEVRGLVDACFSGCRFGQPVYRPRFGPGYADDPDKGGYSRPSGGMA